MFELSTGICNPKHLAAGDYSAYDAVYLGDFSCPKYPDNFSSNIDVLAKAVDTVHGWGKKCFVRLYAVPSNDDLQWMQDFMREVVKLPVDAVEVHNMGLLHMLKQMGSKVPVHLGVFGNLYTHETARVLKEFGVERVYPNPELSLKEIVFIKDQTPIDVLVPVHGKMPLVISETCFIIEHNPRSTGECRHECAEEHWLHRTEGDWSLKDTGRMTLSGKDLCMIEHMQCLAEHGLRYFHVQNLGESADYAGAVGAVYRKELNRIIAGQQPPGRMDQELQALSAYAKIGLCNGYFFESAGQHYIGRE